MQEVEVTRIEPGGSRVAAELRDFWRHRELLYFLTWRDVKIRYKQTAIGIAWAVLQPVLTTAVFTIIFSRFARFDTSDVPYPLFALSGLMIWLFVHTSVTMASGRASAVWAFADGGIAMASGYAGRCRLITRGGPVGRRLGSQLNHLPPAV